MQKLLIVDDGPSICFAMSEYFMMQGYEVDCAQKIEEAEGLLSNDACYSAVIADLCLTGIYNMEGLDVVKFAHERCPDMPIVVLTAYGAPEIETEARSRGAHAFLHKPKPLPDVARVVSGLVKSNSSRSAPSV